MLVASQLPIQTTEIFCSLLTCTCAPHFQKDSATHAHTDSAPGEFFPLDPPEVGYKYKLTSLGEHESESADSFEYSKGSG